MILQYHGCILCQKSSLLAHGCPEDPAVAGNPRVVFEMFQARSVSRDRPGFGL